jgi:hypothetical protein
MNNSFYGPDLILIDFFLHFKKHSKTVISEIFQLCYHKLDSQRTLETEDFKVV